MEPYGVHETIWSHPAPNEEATQLLAAVRAKLNPDNDPAFDFLEAMVVALANDFDASFAFIGMDQWFGVYAKKNDGSFEVRIECDATRFGLAGVYRAFERHAKIMAVLAAIPDATWTYAVGDDRKDSIGHWTLGEARIALRHGESIAWVVNPCTPASSSLWQSCITAGFGPKTVDVAPTTSLRCDAHREPTKLVGHAGICSVCGRNTDDAVDHLCAACARKMQRCQRCADPLTPQG